MTDKLAETTVSLNAMLREETNMTSYLRARNVALAQHVIDRDATIAGLAAERDKLLADLAACSAAPAVASEEDADGE